MLMRKGWTLAATALVAIMALMSLGLGLVSACTFANGHESFEYDISPQEYAAREGAMKAGEQASFLISGGMMDIFVFNEDQYYSYVNLGKDEEGWKGAAAYKEFGVSSARFIFTAPSEGSYFLVIDNTVAGSDPGMAQKTISMDALYPFNAVDNSPPWPFLPLVIGGFVTFTLLVLVVYGRE
jgi:hypothetical protein